MRNSHPGEWEGNLSRQMHPDCRTAPETLRTLRPTNCMLGVFSGSIQPHESQGSGVRGEDWLGLETLPGEKEETEHLDNGERVLEGDVRHGRIRRADRRGGQGRRGEGRLGDHRLKV